MTRIHQRGDTISPEEPYVNAAIKSIKEKAKED